MKYKDIIILLASAFLVVIAWITFNIYHNSVESTTPEVLKKEILPIKPNFDETTINKLKERKRISPIYELGRPSLSPAGLSVNPEIPAENNATSTASPGGQIVP